MIEEHLHLKLVQKIGELITKSDTYTDILDKVTSIIADSLNFEVVSIYLWNKKLRVLELKASKGLFFSADNPIRLKSSEGLTGFVFKTKKTLIATPASLHPRYKYFPASGEKEFESFIGSPIIISNQCLGVLVGQTSLKHSIIPAEETFFDIVSARLAGVIEVADKIINLNSDKKEKDVVTAYQGKGVSKGIYFGKTTILKTKKLLSSISRKKKINPEMEIKLIQNSFKHTIKELKKLLNDLKKSPLGKKEIAIFQAHLLIIEGSSLKKEMIKLIKEKDISADNAISQVIGKSRKKMSASKNQVFKDKAEDFIEIEHKLKNNLRQKKISGAHVSDLAKGTVLIAKNIGPSELISLYKKNIGGIVTEEGGETSHTAILANSLAIPAITGIKNVVSLIKEQDSVLIDGRTGFLFVNPDKSLIEEFEHLKSKETHYQKIILKESNDKRPIVVPVNLTANIGFPSDVAMANQYKVQEVGLFRTEFSFMRHDTWPSIEEQIENYYSVSKLFKKTVTIRTLDIGADKTLSYHKLRKEINPLLGLRSIRFSMENLKFFKDQLKAIMLVHQKTNSLKILLPMISNVWEVESAKEIMLQIAKDLKIKTKQIPPLGIMVEVPSLIYQLKDYKNLIDFISIGTNDLTQYLLAVDRDSASVRHLYSSMHPAVIKALEEIYKQAVLINKDVSVCGEFAGTPKGALVLLALGYKSLSIIPAKIPAIKHLCKNLTSKVLEKVKVKILSEKKETDIHSFLDEILQEIDPLLTELQ